MRYKHISRGLETFEVIDQWFSFLLLHVNEGLARIDYGKDAPLGVLKAQGMLFDCFQHLNGTTFDRALIVQSIFDLGLHHFVASIP